MKSFWIFTFLFVGSSAILQDKWNAFLDHIEELSHKVDDVDIQNATTPKPPPNYDCDPPYEHNQQFECNTKGKRSATRPMSVHRLMPGDIDVVGALGDSITAAYGAGACKIQGALAQYRGVSWSVGGDDTVHETFTLANIIKEYNPNVYGFSTDRGDQNSETTRMNVAVGGAVSEDMYDQADKLISKLRNDENVNVEEDWKLFTLFIGGNDLCSYCTDIHRLSPEQYVENIKKALELLYHEMPRTIVNVVGILNVQQLGQLVGANCEAIHPIACDCAIGLSPEEEKEFELVVDRYQILLQRLVLEGPYNNREDFQLIHQPFFHETKMPVLENGDGDGSYFSPDCFHFSAKGHALSAKELWNNMMEPVDLKHIEWDSEGPVFCPNEEFPYIYTQGNSYGSLPGMTTASASRVQTLMTSFIFIIGLIINKFLI